MLTHSPAETRALGHRLAQLLLPGDVLLLWGDLGAGKSELTRGLADGLGISGPVSSPSFTILNVYEDGCIPLYHFDWYRLQSSEELYDMAGVRDGRIRSPAAVRRRGGREWWS